MLQRFQKTVRGAAVRSAQPSEPQTFHEKIIPGLYAQTLENSVRQFAITFLGLIGSNP